MLAKPFVVVVGEACVTGVPSHSSRLIIARRARRLSGVPEAPLWCPGAAIVDVVLGDRVMGIRRTRL